MTAPLAEDFKLVRWKAAAMHASLADAARAMNPPMSPNAFRQWLMSNPPPADLDRVREVPTITPPAPTAQETRDAAFWRKRATEEQARADGLEHLAEKLAGVREVPVYPVEWAAHRQSVPSRSVIIVHTSDLHMGEKIEAGEIHGFNAYNQTIAADRMMRYFDAACDIAPRWLHGQPCDGALLTMGGDLMSGDIHEELRATNDLTSMEQVTAVIAVYEAGIKRLVEAFGRVHVAAVPGNHGRTTPKPQAKLVSRLSYDILAASLLRERMKDDSRVTWSIASGTDIAVPVYGRNILVTHGDKMGTGGGQGFAGPALPIIRGAKKVQAQSASAGLACDLILMGHYHTAIDGPGVLCNGSVVGYSEYGNTLRAAVEPPQQWLARFSSSWGLCERLPVRLDDPKPKMRMKAA